MRHFSSQTDALTQRGMRVNRFADVHRVRAHLDGQGDFAQHVARVRADDAAAQDLAVATASMAVSQSSFGAVVEQEFGEAFGAPVLPRI